MLRVGVTTFWSPLSRMLKPGCIGMLANWICLAGGWNSLPFQGWKTQGNLPRKSELPFWFQWSEARSSWAKGILHPFPKVPHPECVSPRWAVLSGCATAAFSLNHGLCLRITVLCRETQPASGSRFLPLDKECPRAEREGERAHHLY